MADRATHQHFGMNCVWCDRDELASLVAELVDGDDCWYDHHGYCQAHHLDPKPCPHERAKRLLRRLGEPLDSGHAETPPEPEQNGSSGEQP